MFLTFQCWRTASLRQMCNFSKSRKYCGGVHEKSLHFEKHYGVCRSLSSTPSNFSVDECADESKSCDVKLNCSSNFKRERKKSLSLPTIYLPAELQAALTNATTKYPRRSLVEDGQAMSMYLMTRGNGRRESRSENSFELTDTLWNSEERKSKKGRLESTLSYGKREAMAYAASRIQASYGTVKRVLSEIDCREPSFKPETLLDFGSGLGTVPWAAHQLWSDTLNEYQCVDISQSMGDLAKTLRTGGIGQEGSALSTEFSKEHISDVYFKQYLPVSNKIQYDLVVAAHSLCDLPSTKLRRLSLASLWRKTKHFLVLIELGNWTGFEIIRESREFVLEASTKWTKYDDETDEHLEGHVFAPCPHDFACPLSGDSKKPCHFAQRVQLALCEKDGPLRHKGYRQENFSYIILKKGKRECQSSVARLLQPVKKRTRHIICDLCTPEGEAKRAIFTKKKHGAVYKEGRQSEWGDTLPIPDKNGFQPDSSIPQSECDGSMASQQQQQLQEVT